MAARALFGEQGYAQTSIQAIAARAGVSVPTIYASVGSKAEVAKALVGMIDFQIGGGEARGRLRIETDPRAVLAIGAHVNRVLHEKSGDIVGAIRNAALVEPDVAEVAEMGRRLGVDGATRMAQRLVELGALRDGISEREAADVIGLLADHECYSTLVGRLGWTHDRAEEWIGDALQRLLLEPAI